jgi:hypothetical protein
MSIVKMATLFFSHSQSKSTHTVYSRMTTLSHAISLHHRSTEQKFRRTPLSIYIYSVYIYTVYGECVSLCAVFVYACSVYYVRVFSLCVLWLKASSGVLVCLVLTCFHSFCFSVWSFWLEIKSQFKWGWFSFLFVARLILVALCFQLSGWYV